MATNRLHLNPRSARRCIVLLTLVLGASAILIHAVTPSTASSPRVATGSYLWPVKPFDSPHPVRANFGDPRTTFHAPATVEGLMTGHGIFAFHFGIDISVPDGTAVYAVRSGVASFRGARNVHVDSGGGFATEYWHIIPTISDGQRVVAHETVLGHVMKGYEHVHFAELVNGRPVNPLTAGHLGPYADTTTPEVHEITFRATDGEEVLAESVHGSVDLLARASDLPAQPVAGKWSGLPVAPAVVTWRLEDVDGVQVIGEQVAFDVRTRLPRDSDFWRYYARGSRQNMTTFDKQRAWRQPGVYVYELTRRPFDTQQLPNGIYRIVVTALDTFGNSSSAEQMLIVRNERA